MSIKAGLVGLPNVGKSTLFNALTKSSVPAANYPFCTIEPHLAITEVPDERAAKLQEMYNSERIIPASVSFVDIAGLVKGAASGEGLGNQFLSHIREVDLILHVVRCFEDPDIISSRIDLDPIEDYEIILTELMLKDSESVQKRLEKIAHQIKGAQQKPLELKELTAERELLDKITTALNKLDAHQVRTLIKNAAVQTIPLLSAKDFLIIANMAETDLENQAYLSNQFFKKLVDKFGAERVIAVSAKFEYELKQLSEADAQELMNMLNIKLCGLDTIIQRTYQQLGLITFFTCGPKEIHAWPIRKGLSVRKAAGEIHSDLERGFICAEVFNCTDLFSLGSLAKVREKGLLRTEGQDYIVQDGDIILVRFNV